MDRGLIATKAVKMEMPLMREPFPLLSDWLRGDGQQSGYGDFFDYRYAVDYHVGQLEDAKSACTRIFLLRPHWRHDDPSMGQEWLLNAERSIAFLPRFSASPMVRAGDAAVIAAASAIDATLQVVNFLLGEHGVESKKHVTWRREPGTSPRRNIRAALRQVPGGSGAVVEVVLESIYASMGHELLDNYRDWVTHRGAPRVVVSEPLSHGMVELPPEIMSDPEESARYWRVEQRISDAIRESINVLCVPFVPPVQSVINLSIEKSDELIFIPGFIRIDGHVEKLEIRNSSISYGRSTESAESYRQRNPIGLEGAAATIAGDELVSYTAMDYAHAIRHVSSFIGEVLAGPLDAALLGMAQELTAT